MNDSLQRLLAERAERAPSTPPVGDVLELVRDRAEQRTRRTRNRRAAGSGVVIATAAAITVAVTATNGGTPGSLPAGVQPATAQHASGLHTARQRAVAAAQRARAERLRATRARAAALAAARRAAAVAAQHRNAQHKSAHRAAGDTALVPIAAAPAAAETSISLVPDGWVLQGYGDTHSVYAPPDIADQDLDSFEGKIIVDVHNRLLPDGAHPLTVAGYPASYGGDQFGQSVDMIISPTIDVSVQVPASANLTRDQVVRMADTLDLRSTTERSSG